MKNITKSILLTALIATSAAQASWYNPMTLLRHAGSWVHENPGKLFIFAAALLVYAFDKWEKKLNEEYTAWLTNRHREIAEETARINETSLRSIPQIIKLLNNYKSAPQNVLEEQNRFNGTMRNLLKNLEKSIQTFGSTASLNETDHIRIAALCKQTQLIKNIFGKFDTGDMHYGLMYDADEIEFQPHNDIRSQYHYKLVINGTGSNIIEGVYDTSFRITVDELAQQVETIINTLQSIMKNHIISNYYPNMLES